MGSRKQVASGAAPRKGRNLQVVGSKFRTGRKWTPRELKSFNLVGSKFRTGRKWAPRELKSLNLVGSKFRTGRKWAPQELKSLNLVGSNLRTGRKWTPRELKSLNLVGLNVRTGRKWAPRELKSLNLVGLEDLESGRKGCMMKFGGYKTTLIIDFFRSRSKSPPEMKDISNPWGRENNCPKKQSPDFEEIQKSGDCNVCIRFRIGIGTLNTSPEAIRAAQFRPSRRLRLRRQARSSCGPRRCVPSGGRTCRFGTGRFRRRS